MPNLEFKCDFKDCYNKPYKEVYYIKRKDREITDMKWWYLCRRHFYSELKRKDKKFNCYCKAER